MLIALVLALQFDSLTIARRPSATVDPSRALGLTIDGHEKGDTKRIFTPATLDSIRGAGFHVVSARLRAELGGQVWHWNPVGRWSDAVHRRGYWVSSDTLGAPIDASFGFRLPRRGNTFDQANNDGYSRIADGDTSTFWKSNPYLSRAQWVVLDLARHAAVRSVQITWGQPRATRYRLEAHVGDVDPARFTDAGYWIPFTPGMTARAVRIHLLASNAMRTVDWRDGVGFAIREVSVRDTRGRELVKRGTTNQTQTPVYVSSTDPWHRAEDEDPHSEQPGVDRLAALGLGRSLMYPIGVLYDTPANVAALVRYVRRRALPVSEFEMGEEPEQQYVDPADFAALYRLMADSLRAAAPGVVLGGPSVVSGSASGDPDEFPSRWMKRLIPLLRPGDLQFFTFEWYAFDDVCHPVAPLVAGHERTLRTALGLLERAGIPRTIPWMIAEYGFSPHASHAEIDLEGAITNTEAVATFLEFGGARAYFYGPEPADVMPERGCTAGNLMLFQADSEGGVGARVPAYHAARLLAREWMQPEGAHELYPVASSAAALHAFAAKRPDGHWSLLVINRSSTEAVTVALDARWREALQYSKAQYEWGGERPSRDLPPVRLRVRGTLTFPPLSISVLHDAP